MGNIQILRSAKRRGITKALRKMILRRISIEITIGHMKIEGRLARNLRKGILGDVLHTAC